MQSIAAGFLALVSALVLLTSGLAHGASHAVATPEISAPASAATDSPEESTPLPHDAASEALSHEESLDGAAHAAGHHASSGLPQMDVTWFPSQVFWLAVTFVFLYVVFSKKVLPDISSTLENRRSQIQGDLDSTQTLKEQAENIQKSYEASLAEAHSRASTLFNTVQEEIKRKAAKKTDSFMASAQKKVKQTEESIEDSKMQAMAEMQTIAAEIASAAAEKIIGVPTDIDQAKTLVKNIGRKAA